MAEGHLNVPIVRYLDGKIGLKEAREEIIERCLNYAHQQMEVFIEYPEIIWIEYESTLLPETVDKILAKIKKSNSSSPKN